MEAAHVTPAVRASGLAKFYGEVRALSDVSFCVEAGQVVALLGPNGSGKTTALRAVAGLLRLDGGSVQIFDTDLGRNARDARRQFAYVPQQPVFPANVTVAEMLDFHRKLRGLGTDAVERAIQEADLEAARDRFLGELSGGMRHRLSLAIANLAPVRLMILDEPTASLDPQAVLRLRRQALRWRDAGRAILFSTHVLSDAEELADRVVVLMDGKVVRDEDVARLRADLRQSALLRVDVGAPTPDHERAALEAGATHVRVNSTALVITAPVERRYAILNCLSRIGEIRHFETEEPSIERIYMEYVRGADDEEA